MNKKYIVRLSDEERARCQEVFKTLNGSSQKSLTVTDFGGPIIRTLENKPQRVCEAVSHASLDSHGGETG